MTIYKQYFKFGMSICVFSLYGYYKKQYNDDKQKSFIQLKLYEEQRKFNLHRDLPV